MFQGLDESQIESAIEALLFVSDEAVSASSIASLLEVETSTAQKALESLQKRLEETGSGIQLLQVAGNWRLFTHPAYHELLEKYILSWDTRKLSAAALEVLAIVAYLQPLTRTQISSIRGVTSDGPLNTLLERGYVRETGVADAPGNPALFGTTRTFLEKYGLATLKDLPPLEEFAPDEASARLIRERLGAVALPGANIDAASAGTPTASAPTGNAPDVEGANVADVDFLAENAAATLFGVVEKIDFDSLTFNTDDE